MELDKIYIGYIYELIGIDEISQNFLVKKVKEAVVYKKGYINPIYLDLHTLKKYTGDYSVLEIGEWFINEDTLKPYASLLKEEEKEQDISVRKVRSKYKEYKQINKTN